MRIHLVVHRFPPEGMGGTELYTLHLAHGLSAAGHEVTVLTYAASQGVDVTVRADAYDGIPVRRLGFAPATGAGTVRGEYDDPRLFAALRGLWRAERPDLAHVTHFGHLTTAVAAAAAELDIPWLATLTDFWAVCPNGRLLRADGGLCTGPSEIGECVRCLTAMGPRGAGLAGPARHVPLWAWRLASRGARLPLLRETRGASWLLALCARPAAIRERLLGARALLCPGAFAREMLVSNGYPPDLIRHAPHGIAHPEALRRAAPAATAPALRLGYLGPLTHSKGAHLPIEALSSLASDVPVSLVYRGALPAKGANDAYADALLRRIRSSDRARHDGPYGQSELPGILHALDALIVPSLWYENTPTVIYEALAAGVPVIATDLGGLRELVLAHRGGWLFPREDAASLTALIRWLALDRSAIAATAAEIAPVPTFAAHLALVRHIYTSILGVTV